MDRIKIARAGSKFGLPAELKAEYDAAPESQKDAFLERYGHPWGKPPEEKPAASADEPKPEKAKPVSNEAPDDDGEERRKAMREAVREYIASDLHCIQIAHHGKAPTNKNWRKERLTKDEVDSLYGSHPMPNLGVHLGEASKGVCDVDLDWPLAAAVAEAVTFGDLPAFGRAGKPKSHRLFRCDAKTDSVGGIVKFELPTSKCLEGRLPGAHAHCVLEIRGNGQQTIFPPSVHKETGEPIAWTSPQGWHMPPERKWKHMLELGGLCAFLTVMATLYPPEGVRNDFSLALGGALCRALMKDPAYKDDEGGLIAAVDQVVQVVCKLGGDKGHGKSWEQRGGNTLARIKDDNPATGLPKLCKILGLDEEVEQRLHDWLGLESPKTKAALDEMNAKHAVVADIAGKCVIMNESIDPVTKEQRVSFSSFEAFNHRYENEWITERDGDKPKNLADWWRHHSGRREYETVTFAPGLEIPSTFNLWRGFAVKPEPGDCSLYLNHIAKVICRGDKELYDYVEKWMAWTVQKPGEPIGVALVLRGLMGVGKGEMARWFGRLFGRHFVPVTQQEHAVGRFNALLAEAVVLYLDESFFAANPQHEQILKGLVTEEERILERKGIDAFKVRSCLHIILAANEDWVVPVRHGDRRYCCINVSDERKDDWPYFQAIINQMQNGGCAALLDHLLNIDLTDFNPRNFPRTDEHRFQQAQTRSGVEGFIEEACHEGTLPFALAEHPDFVVTGPVGRTFDTHIETSRTFRGTTPGKVKRKLDREWDAKADRQRVGLTWYPRGIRFKPLQWMRDRFEQLFGEQEWRAANVTDWESDGSVEQQFLGASERATKRSESADKAVAAMDGAAEAYERSVAPAQAEMHWSNESRTKH